MSTPTDGAENVRPTPLFRLLGQQNLSTCALWQRKRTQTSDRARVERRISIDAVRPPSSCDGLALATKLLPTGKKKGLGR